MILLKKEIRKLYSPLFHLIHLPKSAGNSIWRDLIACTDKYSINPNHVIKLDTRNFVDDKYWKKDKSKIYLYYLFKEYKKKNYLNWLSTDIKRHICNFM